MILEIIIILNWLLTCYIFYKWGYGKREVVGMGASLYLAVQLEKQLEKLVKEKDFDPKNFLHLYGENTRELLDINFDIKLAKKYDKLYKIEENKGKEIQNVANGTNGIGENPNQT